VGICVLTQMTLLKVLGTLYFACLPQAGTLYNEVLLLDTNYLLLFLISNAELRSKNEEVGICVLTQMTLLKVLGTWYLVLRLPAAGRYFVQCNLVSCIKKKDYLFVAFFLFFSFFFLLLLRSLGRRLLCRFLGIHSFSHLSGGLRV